MSRSRSIISALALAAALPLAAGCGAGDNSAPSATSGSGVTETCTGTIAVMAPYGDRGGDDGSTMNWARVALDKFNNDRGTAFTILPLPVNNNPAQGVKAARKIASSQVAVGMVGPKSSGVTLAIGPILDKAGIAWVSPSATRTDLANGQFKGFHRVVPDDSIQGSTIGDFIAGPLGGGKVVIVHNPEPYSEGLAASITRSLAAEGITPTAQLVAPVAGRNYRPVISRIPRDTQVVVIPFFNPSDADLFVRQLRATGRNPKIIAGDAVFMPSEFTQPGTYVSSFTPDLRKTKAGAEVIRLYQEIFGDFSPFGGPAYAAMTSIADAALRSCKDGEATRAGVAAALATTNLPSRLLGNPIQFTPDGNLKNGRFHMYRITGSDYIALD